MKKLDNVEFIFLKIKDTYSASFSIMNLGLFFTSKNILDNFNFFFEHALSIFGIILLVFIRLYNFMIYEHPFIRYLLKNEICSMTKSKKYASGYLFMSNVLCKITTIIGIILNYTTSINGLWLAPLFVSDVIILALGLLVIFCYMYHKIMKSCIDWCKN